MKKYKVTDSEVIKALEYCIADRIECDKCALQEECESNPFYSTIAKYALDLIKRQKTEIERLKSMNQAKLDCIHDLQNENKILSRNADTAFQDGLNERRDLFAPEIKAEAYKEFAEKAKENFQNLEYSADTDRKTVKVEEMKEQINWVLHSVAAETLDNILEELVGKKNA